MWTPGCRSRTLDKTNPSPESIVALADDLSFALLVTLQKFPPAERAAFLLHDVFRSFKEVAETLERSEAACRQLAKRARLAVTQNRPAKPVAPAAHKALLAGFLEALASGDASRLGALLKADMVAVTDGGGAKISALRPIVGVDRVTRFFLGLVRKHRVRGGSSHFELLEINGLPGFLVFLDGELDQTLTIEVDEGAFSAIYVVRNPARLAAVRKEDLSPSA